MDQDIQKGQILIAMPTLADPNFRQTVVLVCEHGMEGTLGLILNRPTELEVSALLSEVPDLPGPKRVYTGGPVGKDGMLVLCRSRFNPNGHAILNDISLAKDLQVLKDPELLGPGGQIRCYLGYAGWGPGQLETELKAGAWHTIPGNSEIVFNADPSSVWQETMRKMGGEWSIYATMPPDPSQN